MRQWFYERRHRFGVLFLVWYVGFRINGASFWAGMGFVAIFLFGCFLFYAAVDLLRAIGGWLKPTQNFTVNVHDTTPGHPDIEGTATRHPDPTRPTEEDWAGMITVRLESGRHRRKS